jgi:SAM-dependent methyltransferase
MTTEPTAVSREEVERFLRETDFSGYQAVPLPYGLSVPGIDRRERVAQVLDMDLTGRSLLDVGTNYGIFPCEAVARGASRALGLELSVEHYEIANRIAELNGGRWEVRNGRAEELEADESFDVVLFLNVLHHVTDPVEAVRRLLAVCRDTMVVEFSLPDENEMLVHLFDQDLQPGRVSHLRAGILSRVLRPLVRRLPLMAVGNMPYHRTFYFSPKAFDNLFRVHLGFFSAIRFAPSVSGKRRVVAHCTVAQRSAS